MKNKFLNKFNSIVRINIRGKNINRYVKSLIKDKINIIKLIPISPKEVEIVMYYDDYLKIKKYKTTYKLKLKGKYGKLKLVENIKINKFLLLFSILGVGFLIFLSNVIFEVKVIHSNSSIRNYLYNELKKYNIKRFSMVKSYDEIEKIEDSILKNNKDKIEWLEIKRIGTKYEVKVQERKLSKKEYKNNSRSIIASKNAIIVKIDASSGEKVKEINNYVNKGDIIISGLIPKADGSFELKKAEGKVYGEVWYEVDIEYPYVYNEEKITGNSKDVYVLDFFGKRISIFDFDKYNSFQTKKRIIAKNSFIPITFSKEKQYEVEIVSEIYTKEEACQKAIDEAKKKIRNKSKKVAKFKDVIILSETDLNSKLKLKLFVSAIEDITDYKEEIGENE